MSTGISAGKRLFNKVCLITGASQGIGQGIAQVFYQNGAKLALLDIASLSETVSLLSDSTKQPTDNPTYYPTENPTEPTEMPTS